MLQALGVRKAFILLALIVISVLAFVYKYYHLVPRMSAIKNEASLNQVEVSKNRNKINFLITNHDRFVEQKNQYDFIEKIDFFNKQDRLELRSFLSEIKEKSRVLSARYSVGAVKVELNSNAQEVNYKLLKTEISFDLGALEDADIYNFFFLLNQGFSGVLEITKFDVSRSKKLTQPLLRKIGSGDYEPLITAKIEAVWWTLVPASTVEATSRSVEEF